MNLRQPIRIVLADDHAMVRESLARVLDACPDVSVIGQAGDGKELRQLLAQTRPDCLVMDYSMPGHEPTSLIEELAGQPGGPRVLVLTVHENVHYAVRTLQAGANGYLIKSAAFEELVDAIRAVHAGDVYISRKISPEVWSLLRRPHSERRGLAALSQREFDVLRILGGGATLQDCSRELDISVSTVSTYRSRVLEKLGLNSTSELVRFAIENQIHD